METGEGRNCVCVCVWKCFIVYIYYVLTCYTIDEECIWRDNHNAHLFATFLLRLGGSDGKESIFSAGNLDLIPQSERSPGKGNCYQLQYSCLECPMDRGAWTAHTKLHGRKEEGAERKLISGQWGRRKPRRLQIWKVSGGSDQVIKYSWCVPQGKHQEFMDRFGDTEV